MTKQPQSRLAPPVPVMPVENTCTIPLHEEIATQARILWQHYGQPTGRDVGIWLEAERQVLGVDGEVLRQTGGTVLSRSLAEVINPGVSPPGGEETRRHRPGLGQ